MRSIICIALYFVIALTACTTDGLVGGFKSNATRFQIRGAASDIDCPNGGSVLEYGIDSNINGILDPVEVNGVEIVCNGTNADISLVKLSPEPNGDNCTSGGTRIQQGADSNQNQRLDPEEVLETSYVCNGDNGNTGTSSILTLHDILPGEECENGGTRVESGVDINSNDILDPREVQQVKVICDGVDGVDGAPGVQSPSSLLESTPVTPGEACPTGGLKLTTGLDTNSNGVLDAEEIQHTGLVCNGEHSNGSDAAMSCTITPNEDGTSTLSCPDGTSVQISDGADGAAGANGTNGESGTSASCTVTDNGDGTATITCSDGTTATVSNGANAPSNTIVASIYCTGLLENTDLSFHYTVAQFALGDLFVSGGIWGDFTEVTNATMYSGQQAGYASAPIHFTHDVHGTDNQGFWQLSLDRNTLITIINYWDDDGDFLWAMDPQDCVVNSYGN